MKLVTVKLQSAAPYAQSKFYDVPKLPKELAKDYETRTWRERMHYDEDGMVYIPAQSLAICLEMTAKFLGIQIPGKGKSTYTKHFRSGLMIPQHITLGIHKDEVAGEWLFVPSDGVRGSGKRVHKCFPVIPKWEGTAQIYIVDDTITLEVLEQHLSEAGKFIGLGFWRPGNGGMKGRFTAKVVGCESC